MLVGETLSAFSLIGSPCFRTALPRNISLENKTNRNMDRNEAEQETIEAEP